MYYNDNTQTRLLASNIYANPLQNTKVIPSIQFRMCVKLFSIFSLVVLRLVKFSLCFIIMMLFCFKDKFSQQPYDIFYRTRVPNILKLHSTTRHVM